MFNFADSYVRKYIISKIIETLPKIKVIPGEGHFNLRCQYNSTHYAIKNNNDFVVVVICIEDNFPIIHFLNYDNGNFIDNTLGEHTKSYKHYFWKTINKEEFYNIDDIFGSLRIEIENQLPWYLQLFSKYRC